MENFTQVLRKEVHRRIKIVKPTQNKYIRLFRRCRIFGAVRPVCDLTKESRQRLFLRLLKANAFPYEYTIIRCINLFRETGYSVRLEQPLSHNTKEQSLDIVFRHATLPTLRIRLQLLIQDTEAILSSSLFLYSQNSEIDA